MKKKCKYCGAEHVRRSDYCSKRCYLSARYRDNRQEMLEYQRQYRVEHAGETPRWRACARCGKKIPEGRVYLRFCSRQCYIAAFREIYARSRR